MTTRERGRRAGSTAAVLLAAVAVVVALASVLGVAELTVASSSGDGQAPGQPATPIPSPEPGECFAYGDKVASERAVLGGTARITLTANATCTEKTYPLHVVFVLDASERHGRQNVDRMVSAVKGVVRSCLLVEEYPDSKAGIVEFNDGARVLSQLANDPDLVLRAVGRLRMRDGHDLALGIDDGLRVLRRGHGELTHDDFHEVMVVVSNGVADDAGCVSVSRSASKAKAQGILITSWCSGDECPDGCLRQTASAPRYYYEARQAGSTTSGLCGMFDRIRTPIPRYWGTPLVVRDVLPDDMAYVPGSAYPPPESVSADGKVVEWRDFFVPSDGVTYTLDVMPLELGLHATNVEATGEYSSRQGVSSQFTLPVPHILVEAPTPTYTPTASPTATPTPTPSPTATPTVQSLHLPRVLRLD